MSTGTNAKVVVEELTVGKIVHFVLSSDVHRSAIILHIVDGRHSHELVNLAVFTDESDNLDPLLQKSKVLHAQEKSY